jgi:signal transduction histidine kinase/ActR/RegA family two-component response regulator
MRPLSSHFFSRLITIWIALSAGGIVLGVVLWGQLNASLEMMVEDAKLREEVNHVFSMLLNAETGQRGFILTGNESYLEPYNQAEASLPAQFDALARMTFRDDVLRKDVLDLRALAALKMAEMRRTVETRRKRDLSGAIAIIQRNEGKTEMDRMRSLVADMNARMGEPPFVQQEATRKAIRRALFTTIGSSFLGFGAGLLAFYLSRIALRQELNARSLAEQALTSDRAVREKSAFLANMSHEIRTPMNAILGFSDLLSAELQEHSKARSHARAIRESTASLLQLINDILDLSKIEAGMIELHLEPTAMAEVADFLRTIFAQQAAIKGLTLDFILEPGLPQALVLDLSRMRQVLVNLIGNAIKYTERGGVDIQFGWKVDPEDRTHGTLTIEVSDTGIGIPAERREEIFEPFVQIDPTPAQEAQGSGLGLSIVKRLVKRMGGTVSFESTVGVGTVFRVAFPGTSVSARLPENTRREQDDEVDFNDFIPSRLLVVDDNSVNRNLLAGYFETTHHRVRFASNGIEAVESVRRDRPDLILMDVRMPKLDGRSALGEIHRIPGAEILPVIAVTASSMSGDEASLRQLFAGYVRKPFTRRTLFDEMAAFLPRKPKRDAERSAPAEPAETPHAEWGDLVRALEDLQAGTWPAVKEGGAINEIASFAAQLSELGRSAGCPRLASYGEDLERDARAYAVARIESRLNDFPILVRAIAEENTAPSP